MSDAADQPADAAADARPISDDEFAEIHAAVAALTMVAPEALRVTVDETLAAVSRHPTGAIVECGVWRGGASIAMLLAQHAVFGRIVCPVWMLDSFEGLPAASERDGPLAREWQQDVTSPIYYDNCRAPLEHVTSALGALGVEERHYRLVPGWFHDTLPGVAQELRSCGITALRLDGDWYESTLECLEHLEVLVAQDGPVIVDDYYAWDGCARAVHDYLSRHDLAYRIRSMPMYYGAFFYRRPFRASYQAL